MEAVGIGVPRVLSHNNIALTESGCVRNAPKVHANVLNTFTEFYNLWNKGCYTPDFSHFVYIALQCDNLYFQV